MAQTDVDQSDEVTFTEYLEATDALQRVAVGLGKARPDEAAEHWLPELTRLTAVIFSFVGSNMTARHVPHYARTVAALNAAKDVGARLPTSPQPGGTHGGIADRAAGPGAGAPAGT